MTAKKAVAKKPAAGLPANLAEEMAADAGDGTQSMTSEDLAIPFLRILQQMSPQLAKRDGAFIKGAEEGMLFNTVTGQLWDGDEGVVVIPCGYNFRILEWKPRDSGGGIVNTFTREDELPSYSTDNERKQMITDEGNLLSDTAEHFVMIVHPDGTVEQALMSMSSTALKKSRRWNSLMKQQTIITSEGQKTMPSYGKMYRAKTMGETKDDNNWSNWDITIEGDVTDIEVYRACKQFSASVMQNAVKVVHKESDAPF